MRADCCQISTGPPQGPSPICYTKPSLTVYPGAYAHALRRDLRGTPSVEEAAALTPKQPAVRYLHAGYLPIVLEREHIQLNNPLLVLTVTPNFGHLLEHYRQRVPIIKT